MTTDDFAGFVSRMAEMRDAEVPPQRAEMRRLADAARVVIDRLVATRAPLGALQDAADALERIASALDGYPRGHTYEGFAVPTETSRRDFGESSLAGGIVELASESASRSSGREPANSGDPHAFFDHSPLIGLANPLAPPLRLAVQGARVVGTARFGAAYEGPPGCVHGGYIAAAFDEVLGMAQSLGGRPGMTGTLTVRYRRPTPLRTDLRFEATLDGTERRKIFTSGRLYDATTDEVTAEAEAIFISVDFSKIAERFGPTG